MLGGRKHGQLQLIPLALVLFIVPTLILAQSTITGNSSTTRGTIHLSDLLVDQTSDSQKLINPDMSAQQSTSSGDQTTTPDTVSNPDQSVNDQQANVDQSPESASADQPAADDRQNVSDGSGPTDGQPNFSGNQTQTDLPENQTRQSDNETTNNPDIINPGDENQTSNITVPLNETLPLPGNETQENQTDENQTNETISLPDTTQPKLAVSLSLPGRATRMGVFTAVAQVKNTGDASATISSVEWLLHEGFAVLDKSGNCDELQPGESCDSMAEISVPMGSDLGSSLIKVLVRY